ncbi:hypothetical protein BD626DRAFT_515268 [Schizophyllum amplum]|uniref:Uncharacterized protein n=1 Tax=Schizophyllum amplum TaxID=97359 RepID=A0A550BXN4_9AGAR|nr:hypothetical protein BD626DRAFT_515268 [Auriculariopsis ampla]
MICAHRNIPSLRYCRRILPRCPMGIGVRQHGQASLSPSPSSTAPSDPETTVLATSLTRTLLQALHFADTRMLEEIFGRRRDTWAARSCNGRAGLALDSVAPACSSICRMRSHRGGSSGDFGLSPRRSSGVSPPLSRALTSDCRSISRRTTSSMQL